MLRYFHSTTNLASVSKSVLAKLRKKTGYTYANIRKALELHENDATKAEEWLREQATVLGWAKATKLEGRPTAQGLIGVTLSKDKGILVEVNCETDFVARNAKFRSLVELVSATCLKTNFSEQLIRTEEIKAMKAEDGVTLADHTALLIGNLGENLSLRRAFCYVVPKGVKLAGLTHPPPTEHTKVYVGKFGALVAYTAADDADPDLGKQLCQHIIGMNPQTIGVIGEDDTEEKTGEVQSAEKTKEVEPTEKTKEVESAEKTGEDELSGECSEDESVRKMKEDETRMVHQEYLLDPEITVGQLLTDNNASVVAFQRFECGETIELEGQTDCAEEVRSTA